MTTNRQDRKGKSIPMVAVHSEVIDDIDDDKEIRERYLIHIAEITKDLAPPKFANLTEDQQDFLDRKGRYAPYRPTRSEVEEEEEDEEYW